MLLVGRLLGGVSTSLLFSVFEAWAVAAHTSRGFDESLLVNGGTKGACAGERLARGSCLAGVCTHHTSHSFKESLLWNGRAEGRDMGAAAASSGGGQAVPLAGALKKRPGSSGTGAARMRQGLHTAAF